MVIVAPPGIPLRMLELGTVRAARGCRWVWNFSQGSLVCGPDGTALVLPSPRGSKAMLMRTHGSHGRHRRNDRDHLLCRGRSFGPPCGRPLAG